MTADTPSPSEVDLLPCPFCGGEAKAYQDFLYGTNKRDPNGWFVRCDPCDLIIDAAWGQPSLEAAVKGWNTRAPSPRSSTVDEATVEAVARAIEAEFYRLVDNPPACGNPKGVGFKSIARAAIASLPFVAVQPMGEQG